MTRLLHTRTKIFFSEPYVLMVEYKDATLDIAESRHRKSIWAARKIMSGTWGFTSLEYEAVMLPPDGKAAVIVSPFPGLNGANGINPVMIANLFGNDMEHIPRAYVCFEDELDALQYKLSLDASAKRVGMWPSQRWFTVYELSETDEQ